MSCRFAPPSRHGRCGDTSGTAAPAHRDLAALNSTAVPRLPALLLHSHEVDLGLHRGYPLELHVQGLLDLPDGGFQPLHGVTLIVGRYFAVAGTGLTLGCRDTWWRH